MLQLHGIHNKAYHWITFHLGSTTWYNILDKSNATVERFKLNEFNPVSKYENKFIAFTYIFMFFDLFILEVSCFLTRFVIGCHLSFR